MISEWLKETENYNKETENYDKALTLNFEDVINKPTRDLWYEADLKELLKKGDKSSKLVKLAVNVATNLNMCSFNREKAEVKGCDINLNYNTEDDGKLLLSVSITKKSDDNRNELANIKCNYRELNNDEAGVIDESCDPIQTPQDLPETSQELPRSPRMSQLPSVLQTLSDYFGLKI
jgi:hypothetical protein